MLRETLSRYSDTPLISRTGSRGFHCYYRHDGEKRKIRIGPNMLVDLIGAGMVAAPPSLGSSSKEYAFIRGDVANLQTLPTIKASALNGKDFQVVRESKVAVGRRNS